LGNWRRKRRNTNGAQGVSIPGKLPDHKEGQTGIPSVRDEGSLKLREKTSSKKGTKKGRKQTETMRGIINTSILGIPVGEKQKGKGYGGTKKVSGTCIKSATSNKKEKWRGQKKEWAQTSARLRKSFNRTKLK